MFNIHVTESGKDHTGAPFAGLVNVNGITASFFTVSDAKDFVADNPEFFAEFVTVAIVKDGCLIDNSDRPSLAAHGWTLTADMVWIKGNRRICDETGAHSRTGGK